jgi:hypothetical protein
MHVYIVVELLEVSNKGLVAAEIEEKVSEVFVN